MAVFLCRHGETENNSKKIVQGQMNSAELNQKGRSQAKKLSERFEYMEIEKIYSSSLKRAEETAEIIANKHDLDIEKSDLLNEVNRSEFEGKKFDEMVKEIDNSDLPPHEWSPENGETLIEMQKRGLDFLEKVKNRHQQDKNVLIIAHGGINSSLVLGILGHSAKNCYYIHQDNCCVNKFIMTERHGLEVKGINDVSHL